MTGRYAEYDELGKCIGTWAIIRETPEGRFIFHERMTPEELAQHPNRNSDGTVKA